MDFVFSNSPQRTATMTRSMVWAALDEGHIIFEESSHFEDGSWRMTLQNPELTIPANPFVYGHTGTVAAVAGGAAPAGWHVAWDPQSFDALHWSQVYGDAMWNHASVQFMALEEALARWPDQGWHMRPCGADSGPKAFKGFFQRPRGFGQGVVGKPPMPGTGRDYARGGVGCETPPRGIPPGIHARRVR